MTVLLNTKYFTVLCLLCSCLLNSIATFGNTTALFEYNGYLHISSLVSLTDRSAAFLETPTWEIYTTEAITNTDSLNLESKVLERGYNAHNLVWSIGNLYDETLESYPPQLNDGWKTLGRDKLGVPVDSKFVNTKELNRGRIISADNSFLKESLSPGQYNDSDARVIYIRLPSDYISDSSNLMGGFWVNTEVLNGNGIYITGVNGVPYRLTNSQLKTVGSKMLRWGVQREAPPCAEVTEVYKDYSFLTLDFSVLRYVISIAIHHESPNKVNTFEIFNPVLIEGKYTLDPFYDYQSEAETKNSDKIGKTCIIVGDSQHQDRIFQRMIARKTGMNVISMAKGGHSIKYQSKNSKRSNMFWFYSKTLKDIVLSNKNIDYYILPLSTNDAEGGGVLSLETIQAVIDNYPFYGDSPETVSKKLALFNAMNGKTKEEVFGYKQTFAAYIMQLKLVNPNAKFLLASIPISPTHLTGELNSEGHGVWKDGWNAKKAKEDREWIFNSIRKDSKTVAKWSMADWVDLMNKVDLNFENAPQFCSDGTHWFPEIKKRIGEVLSNELLKI
ncbi:hypothetical protein ACFFU1_01665 [Algibacter miyuki]|uniref:SGNH hydrolase-type esterase domain-containing protein n=1 Tax=Algibacter miyuki TaxID=1306933 RepID=A0ABV5GVD3_9FLAO|nr:hypothetical protein [Algibacter miyuki]MDN3664919.1 hypothetical protein [Algibacter miyuki]